MINEWIKWIKLKLLPNLSPNLLSNVLEPLNKYQDVYSQLLPIINADTAKKDKNNAYQAKKILLAALKSSIEAEMNTRETVDASIIAKQKDFHDALFNLSIHCISDVQCSITLSEMNDANKDLFVMLLSGQFYKREALCKWFDERKTDPGTNESMTPLDWAYLEKLYGMQEPINSPINTPIDPQPVNRPLIIMGLVILAMATVTMGALFALLPLISLGNLARGRNQQSSYDLLYDITVGLNENHKRTLFAYRAGNVALSFCIFSMMYFTGLSRLAGESISIAENGTHKSAEYYSISIACGVASLVPQLLMYIGGKNLEKRVNRLVGEGGHELNERRRLINP